MIQKRNLSEGIEATNKMAYEFTEKQKNKIIEKWGNDFHDKIVQTIEIYSEKWKLSDFEFVEYYSIHAIFFCKSELYGDCVLRIGDNDDDEDNIYGFMSEYNALLEFNDSGKFCKIFDCDADKNIMLIERIIPGTMLKNEPSLEKRLSVFSELFNGLHKEPKNPERYASPERWLEDIDNILNFLGQHEKYKELYSHGLKAKELILEIMKTYDRRLLLHGDLHFENILLDKDGMYKIIDPISVIKDPVFEVGRYITNEYWNDRPENRFETIEKIIKYFVKNLKIPDKILRQSFYIDITTLNCWRVMNDSEDLDSVKFAWNVMNKNNHKGTQTIKTERLILRKILIGDAEMMFKWMSDPEVLRYEDWDPHQNADYTRGYISYITGDYKSDETYLWGIQLGDELIGHILGGNILAYYLRKDFWSKGYTTEAVRAVIKYMFTEVGIDRIEAKHSVKNAASGKVLKKAGMIFEKHEKAVYYCNGEWQDCDFYFLTKDDFNKIM